MPDKKGDRIAVAMRSPFVGLREIDMPNPFDEYINSLEGQTEVDPLTIARDLREIHTQELSTREAKITELNGTVAERDGSVSKLSAELTAQKARNFDLVSEIPSRDQVNSQSDSDDEKPDASTIKIADLFNPNVRTRHGL